MPTSVAITNSSATRRLAPTCAIGRIAAAESIIALLSLVDVSAFPPEESMAVADIQSAVIEDWLDAYGESR